MTEENYNYRTSPMFLRNQFSGNGKWKIPAIPKFDSGLTVSDDLRLIGFDKIKSGKDEHHNRIVHFFLYDYKFEDIWTKPDKYIDVLKKYKAVLTPDYSMYIEMNPVMQLYNTFRNRWVGAYLAENGIDVIPTVSWGLDNTFDFCFNGIEKGSAVAVSTYMVSEHGNHKDQKEFFLKGYNEMLRRIEPELIICYNTPFPEMEGNILFVDYDLSSWQHYNDDLDKSATSIFIKNHHSITSNRDFRFESKKKCAYGYVISDCDKGIGSAYGGEWQPKKEADKRFLGTPNTVNQYLNENGDLFEIKIGEDGRAVMERHNTTHNREHTKHTNPHDHIIDWSNGIPHLEEPINYEPGTAPEFKHFVRIDIMKQIITTDDLKFESTSDFKYALIYGREIQFEWNGIEYGAFNDSSDKDDGEKVFFFCEAHKDDEGVYFNSVDDLLDFVVDGRPLKEFITEVKVYWRNL